MDNKDKIVRAINTLVQNDPNFADNISKLADLVVRNKFIYQQAVNKLKSL
jgi:ubiquinone biosynthesis protein Coq4